MTWTTYKNARPSFVGDYKSVSRWPTGVQIVWASVPEDYRETAGGTVKLAAAALADAVALTVDALTFAVPSGTKLHFGQSKEFALVTADADIGDTSLTVEALPSALEDDDEAIVTGSGKKTIRAGTRLGWLADAQGQAVPRSATVEAVGILETDAVEDDTAAPGGGMYGMLTGGEVYENLLPGATGDPMEIPAAEKTELAANSRGFLFVQYEDVP
jgi:hypothetical protein